MRIGFYELRQGVEIPKIQTKGSACFDLAVIFDGLQQVQSMDDINHQQEIAIIGNQLTIPPFTRVMIPMGYILDIPSGYSVRIHPRSSMAWKRGLILANTEAVIDSDYVEELKLLMWNTTHRPLTIGNRERIAQGELVKVEEVSFGILNTRPKQKTNRQGGIGSTGVAA